MRPVLRPGLRLLRRDATTVQLGLEPCRAVLIDDCPVFRAVLAAMDGVRRYSEVVAAAAADGIDADAAEDMLAGLRRCGAIEDADELIGAESVLPLPAQQRLAPDVGALSLLSALHVAEPSSRPSGVRGSLQRRRRARVGIRGFTGLGRVASRQLASAGIGGLVLQDPRLCEELAEVAPWTSVHRWPSTEAVDAVLLVPDAARGVVEPQRREADALLRDGVPHLMAVAYATVARLGPFVIPGTTACLRCLDLAQAETDPAWPAVLEQLVTPAPVLPGAMPAIDSTLVSLAGVWAALEILALIQALPVRTAGATVEVSLAEPSPARRCWPAHPACGCGWDRTATMGA